MPSDVSTSAAASSIANMQGWVFEGSLSSSGVPSKHCFIVPGRKCSRNSNTLRAGAYRSQRSLPMPGY